jgi:hypothetical protein
MSTGLEPQRYGAFVPVVLLNGEVLAARIAKHITCHVTTYVGLSSYHWPTLCTMKSSIQQLCVQHRSLAIRSCLCICLMSS